MSWLVRRLNVYDHWKLLRQNGYIIIDDVFDDGYIRDILAEMKALKDFDILYPCHTHVLSDEGKTELIKKENVYEFELHRFPELNGICKSLNGILNDGNDILNSINETGLFGYTFVKQTLKVLYSYDNGCFPIHFDSENDTRNITVILYFNEDNESNINGELKLYPLNREPIVIKPVFNRMVMFSSKYMLHRTLPCNYDRYSLNLWLHSDFNRMDDDIKGKDDHILEHKYIKCLGKLMFFDEWKQSIIESHGDNMETQYLLKSHEKDRHICEGILGSVFDCNISEILNTYKIDWF